ncbi:MAG TPA: hypothetical protein VFG10_07265 [Saprospiraceae bacterium]|nr:hypothetical protein [Saprospiraceae bacterium]
MKIEWLAEYEKDLKHYRKKFQTIDADVEDVKIILRKKPDQRPPFSYRIEGLGIETCVIKIKKIACRSLKGRGVNSGFRLIYAHFEREERIVLVELYHKADKEMEDRERIRKNFK